MTPTVLLSVLVFYGLPLLIVGYLFHLLRVIATELRKIRLQGEREGSRQDG